MRRVSPCLLLLLLTGCLTHLRPGPGENRALQVHWQKDFAAGQRLAQSEGKPILMVLAAGELDGPC